MTKRLHFHFSLSCIGGGNGNPLQCSCLENPRDRGALWAAVYGIAQSQRQLNRLSSSSSSSSSNNCLNYIEKRTREITAPRDYIITKDRKKLNKKDIVKQAEIK